MPNAKSHLASGLKARAESNKLAGRLGIEKNHLSPKDI